MTDLKPPTALDLIVCSVLIMLAMICGACAPILYFWKG